MISRRSALLIAEAYHEKFSDTYRAQIGYTSEWRYKLLGSKLYDFLYSESYDAWFLNQAKALDTRFERALREFVMRLHTGETAVSATPNWTWEDRQKLGQRYLKDLAESILNNPEKLSAPNSKVPSLAKMRSQLELDGYIFKDGSLYESESSVINEKSEQSYLSQLVSQLKLTDPAVIEHHMDLAEEHYQNQKWDDSIGNSRKFLEAILAQSAAKYFKIKNGKDLSENALSRPVEVRETLEREGLLEAKEKDALAKVYGLLSNTGSHPNIAAKDQARLMWHLALTFSQFVLLRLEGYLKTAAKS